MATEGIKPGWVYMCADGTYAHQVVVQKLRSGKIRIVCHNTGGQSVAVAERLLKEVGKLIEEKGIDWSEVDVEEAED